MQWKCPTPQPHPLVSSRDKVMYTVANLTLKMNSCTYSGNPFLWKSISFIIGRGEHHLTHHSKWFTHRIHTTCIERLSHEQRKEEVPTEYRNTGTWINDRKHTLQHSYTYPGNCTPNSNCIQTYRESRVCADGKKSCGISKLLPTKRGSGHCSLKGTWHQTWSQTWTQQAFKMEMVHVTCTRQSGHACTQEWPNVRHTWAMCVHTLLHRKGSMLACD